jgi:hypothetical protein
MEYARIQNSSSAAVSFIYQETSATLYLQIMAEEKSSNTDKFPTGGQPLKLSAANG